MFTKQILASLLIAAAGVQAAPSLQERQVGQIEVQYNSGNNCDGSPVGGSIILQTTTGCQSVGGVNVRSTLLVADTLSRNCRPGVRFYSQPGCHNSGDRFFDITSDSTVGPNGGCHSQGVQSAQVFCTGAPPTAVEKRQTPLTFQFNSNGGCNANNVGAPVTITVQGTTDCTLVNGGNLNVGSVGLVAGTVPPQCAVNFYTNAQCTTGLANFPAGISPPPSSGACRAFAGNLNSAFYRVICE